MSFILVTSFIIQFGICPLLFIYKIKILHFDFNINASFLSINNFLNEYTTYRGS